MTVVMGIGNPLMGDDGIGIAAIAAVRERWAESECLSIIDGGTWGMNLLPFIESADRLLILDAIDRGAAPGSVIALDGDEIPRQLTVKISPHQTDLREALAVAELRGTLPPEMVALGIQPASVLLSTNLSAFAAAALPALLRDVEIHLRRWGHQPVTAAHA